MISLVVVNQKGGVGKTTLALNLAYALASRKHRTLLVDTDPQGAIGNSLRKRSDGAGLLQFATEQRALSDAVTQTRLDGFGVLLSGTRSVPQCDQLVEALTTGNTLDRLLRAAANHCDICVLDTPSGLHGITRAVMRKASHAICPLQAEPLALRCVDQVIEAVAMIREAGEPLELTGFVLTMLQMRNEVGSSVAREVWESFPTNLVFEATIPRDSAILAAGDAGVPIALLSSPPPPIAGRFEELAIELEPRLGLVVEKRHAEPVSFLV